MVQWLRICLLVQGTRVRSLVRDGPTCCGATKPLPHNYGAQGLQQQRPLQWGSCAPQLESSPCSPQLEKAHSKQQRPSAAKNNFFFKEIISASHSGTYCCCSVAQSCPTLCTPGFPVLHNLPEFAQTHVHGVSDAMQPSHSLCLKGSKIGHLQICHFGTLIILN